MNLLKLENALLQFALKHQLHQILVNGITAKISAIMYNQEIDYYYSDAIATALDVPIKLIDNIYCNNQAKYYNKSLCDLLEQTDYQGTKTDAKKLEQEVIQILKTKKRIHTKKCKKTWNN